MIKLLMCLFLLLGAGCGYMGEVTQVWVPDTGGVARADSITAETLDKLLDQVGYAKEREAPHDPLIHGRLIQRLQYLATFPTRLVMLTNLAEQRIMSPNPVSEAQIGRLPELPADEAREEIAALLVSSSAARRLYGLALLGEQGIGLHGAQVTELLADENISVRNEVARLVGKVRYTPAIGGLQQMALSDPDEFNRISAMLALEQISGRKSLKFLRRLARDSASPFVRAKACSVLAGYPEARTLKALVNRLQQDSEWLVRDEAAGALHRLTRIPIPRSAYREPRKLGQLLTRLRAWCRENKLDALF